MRSIASRLLVGNAIVLAVFVVLTALAVSFSVHRRAETAHEERLQGLVYGLLGATEIARDAGGDGSGQGPRLVVDRGALPDDVLSRPTGGLYAELVAPDGERYWRSRSSVARVPPIEPAALGEWRFERLAAEPARGLPAVDRLSLHAVWALDDGTELPFAVHIVDEAGALGRELARFDRTLWATLLGAAVALLAVQILVLRRALAPLNAIGEEVRAVERGERDALDENVPGELGPLAGSLNALLASERGRRERYRDLLDDLAHSLKTPLTILGNLAGSGRSTVARADGAGAPDPEDRRSGSAADGGDRSATAERDATIREQTERMRLSVARYLERARRPGGAVLAPPLAVRPVAERLAASLGKLHRDRAVAFDVDVDPALRVRVADADLHEILGNVLENAVKYGAARVRVHGEATEATLVIDDDGPGFPPALVARLAERGVRADSRVAGEGLGLAASRELLEAHGGTLSLAASPEGGARVTLCFAERRPRASR